jgi:hypothetical protein
VVLDIQKSKWKPKNNPCLKTSWRHGMPVLIEWLMVNDGLKVIEV